jgi:ribosomal protein S18 acetylase RimI-like enzyme
MVTLLGVDVRDSLPSEHVALGELCVAAYSVLGGLSEGYREQLRDVARRAETARVLVAVEGRRLLGCATLILEGGPLRELAGADEGEFRMLAVDPGAQRRGVGEALVRACVEEARRADRARIVLSSAQDMTAAHRLYERLGFARAPARDWSPVAGVELIAYELEL